MKRLRNSIVLVLILNETAIFAAPIIGVDNPTYEVSIQNAGVPVSHIFTITNTGNQTLNISNAQPSCVCTKATPTKVEVAPGNSVAISVSVDTTGFRGLVVRTVTLLSNDPANPRLVLAISITNTGESQAQLPTISINDFQKRFYLLIDVRTPEEYALGHLLGAVNIPLSELQNNIATLAQRLPKDVPIVLQCRSGVRSAQATQILLKAGFSNVFNLDGGIINWTKTFGSGYLFSF